MIYTSAIYANPDHTMVTGTDANGATETVPVGHFLFREPKSGPVGFVRPKNQGGVGGTIADYVAPSTASAEANGIALEDRQRKTAKDEAAALASAGEYEAAFIKLLEII